jgi:nucleotide-binding universal stress UspA family protein
VQAAPCPVLLLPPDYLKNKKNSAAGAPAAVAAVPELGRILVNYDFTAEAEEILGFAFALARSFKSEIHLLHVFPNSEKAATELFSNSAGQKILEKMLLEKMHEATAGRAGEECRIINRVSFGEWQNKVLEYAKNEQIDLICSAVPKPKFLLEAVFPTRLGHFLQHSACPVIVKSVSAGQNSGKIALRKKDFAEVL